MLHGGAPTHGLDEHIHADLQIVIEGQPVAIPQDVGVDGTGIIDFVHTHDADNRIHLHPIDTNGDGTAENPASFLTVGDFFETWRTNAGTPGNNPDAVFSATEILGNVADDQHTIRMYVNGIQIDEYENYAIHDEDDIVISYSSNPVVSLETNHGTILMEMLSDDAPNTVANFLNYVNDGDYVNSFVHRSMTDFVIQGGGFLTSSEAFSSLTQFTSVPTDPPITNEFAVSNTLGTVAMAKLGNDPDSATSQWFVNLVDNSSNLDAQNGGFTVFARVLDMQPVEVMAGIPTQNEGGAFTHLPVNVEGELVVVESVAGDGTVSGVVYDDANGDGIRQTAETPLSEVDVFIDESADGVLDEGETFVTTATDGSYQFRLPAGEYAIRQQVPTDKTQTSPAVPGQTTTVLIGGETTDLDFGSSTVPSVPNGIDLLDVTDTGSSTVDNVTSKNNSSLVESLQFRVTGVDDSNVVRIFADGQELGQAVAIGGEAVVITEGSQTLVDGNYDITATQSLGLLESPGSFPLSIEIDTVVEDFTSTPPTTATIAEVLSYDVQNPEEGNSGFSYAMDDLPTGLTINASTGVISWTPVAAQLGTEQFVVTATDAAGNTRDQSISVDVGGEVLVNYRLEAVDDLGNAITEINVGGDFTFLCFAQDLRSTPTGLFAGYLDVVITNQLVSPTGPIVFGDDYPNITSGTLVQAGLIDEVGGASNSFSVLDGSERLLFSVPMRANLAGSELFASNPADLEPESFTLLFDSDVPVDTAKIAYQSYPLTVNVGFTVEPDLFNFDEDSQDVLLSVLLNDVAADGGDPLTITSVGTPDQNGTVSIAGDGQTLVYSPAADFFGVETISYTASDSTGSLQTTAVVQVHPQPDDPTATNDLFTTEANSENVFFDLLQNDTFSPDVGEELEIISVSTTTQSGLVMLGPNGTHVSYTPAANFNGVETFNYTISDGRDGEATATVTVQVGDQPGGPSAGSDAISVGEDSLNQTVDVLANDEIGEAGGSLLISSVSTPTQGGTVQIAVDDLSLIYSPLADFFGTETFFYTVGDGVGGSTTGQVTVTVTSENDPPTANNDSLTAIKNGTNQVLDPLGNDTIAPDTGETLTITATGTLDQGGTATIATDGKSLLYTPATDFSGQETIPYTITDGTSETAQATITVDVVDYIPSKLAGKVYLDADNDGLHGGSEMILAGVTVTLEGTDFHDVAVSQTRTTDSRGGYEFSDLAPGSYVISQLQPAYLIDGQESVGSQGGSNSQNDQIVVELSENTNGEENNFAERGREASTFTLADFTADARASSLVGSFGDQVEEQWVALDTSWDEYEATNVIWYENSHTLVINVSGDDEAVSSAVLSWEAGDPIRQLGNDLLFPLITLDGESSDVGFSALTGETDVKVPDFSLPDVNETSSTHGQDVSPRDYEGNVTAFYFGLATCNYCTAQFGHLDSLQDELDASQPELGIEIVGINSAGLESSNDVITEGPDLPWLQDVDGTEDGDSDAWAAWQVQVRDVVIVDATNHRISTYNLTGNDLAETANYNHLKDLLIGAATAEGETDVYYQQEYEFDQAISLISRDQLQADPFQATDQEYSEAVDEILHTWL